MRCLAACSHGLLDRLTDGGLGVAILAAVAMGFLGARQVALPVVALKDAALTVAEG